MQFLISNKYADIVATIEVNDGPSYGLTITDNWLPGSEPRMVATSEAFRVLWLAISNHMTIVASQN